MHGRISEEGNCSYLLPLSHRDMEVWTKWRHYPLFLHTLRWRHNGCGSVSNHQPHHCLLNRLFRRRSKKTSTVTSMLCKLGHRWFSFYTMTGCKFGTQLLSDPVLVPYIFNWTIGDSFSEIRIKLQQFHPRKLLSKWRLQNNTFAVTFHVNKFRPTGVESKTRDNIRK